MDNKITSSNPIECRYCTDMNNATPPLHMTWIQFLWPPGLKASPSILFLISCLYFVAFEDVTKNAIKAHKKHHRVIVRTKATTTPRSAPDESRLCFFKPLIAIYSGIMIAEEILISDNLKRDEGIKPLLRKHPSMR